MKDLMKTINLSKMTIKEISDFLNQQEQFNQKIYDEMLNDSRKGVQQSAKRWLHKFQKLENTRELYQQKNIWEEKYFHQGYQKIAGIDEVGRGPLAGPVVAAAVILDPKVPIYGLKDSKQLTEKERIQLFNEIKQKAISYSIAEQTSEQIDQLNIYEATRQAMKEAVQDLKQQPDLLFIDAMEINSNIKQVKIIKGDDQSNSIAAASILAKVTRDQMMVDYSRQYPHYDWENNKGYGTAKHIEGLNTFGVSPIHRKSFKPVSDLL